MPLILRSTIIHLNVLFSLECSPWSVSVAAAHIALFKLSVLWIFHILLTHCNCPILANWEPLLSCTLTACEICTILILNRCTITTWLLLLACTSHATMHEICSINYSIQQLCHHTALTYSVAAILLLLLLPQLECIASEIMHSYVHPLLPQLIEDAHFSIGQSWYLIYYSRRPMK